jgi:hypothetical protein
MMIMITRIISVNISCIWIGGEFRTNACRDFTASYFTPIYFVQCLQYLQATFRAMHCKLT